MAFFVVAGASGAGCSDQPGVPDAGPPVCATPATLQCCEHDCDNDVFTSPVCTESGWSCPQDYVSSTYCPGPRFCLGPLPGPYDAGTGNVCDDSPGLTLVCCVGGCANHVTTSPVCDVSGWHCPPGTVSQNDCPGQPFCF
jgi:hypothetical protein